MTQLPTVRARGPLAPRASVSPHYPLGLAPVRARRRTPLVHRPVTLAVLAAVLDVVLLADLLAAARRWGNGALILAAGPFTQAMLGAVATLLVLAAVQREVRR